MEVKFLKAKHGDSSIIRWEDKNNKYRYLIVDGGVRETYATELKRELKDISELEALILTHVDYDHIGGFLKLLEYNEDIQIKKFIVNNPELIETDSLEKEKNISHGIELLKKIEILGQKENCLGATLSNFDSLKSFENLSIELLSPKLSDIEQLNAEWGLLKNLQDEKDCSDNKKSIKTDSKLIPLDKLSQKKDKVSSNLINDCSIACILRSSNKSYLMLGDANPKIIYNSLYNLGYNKNSKLKVNYWKLSHHGSKYNITKPLISIIETLNYVFSTNGGSGIAKHPNRETIAKIVCRKDRNFEETIFLWFNYDKEDIERKVGTLFTKEEEDQYNFKYKLINNQWL